MLDRVGAIAFCNIWLESFRFVVKNGGESGGVGGGMGWNKGLGELFGGVWWRFGVGEGKTKFYGRFCCKGERLSCSRDLAVFRVI